MSEKSEQQAFLSFVRAGLWPVHVERGIVNDFSNTNWNEVYQLACQQSVVGLVTAGIEQLQDATGDCSSMYRRVIAVGTDQQGDESVHC